jgi:GTP-binding protein EngB required for normal cell division
MGEDRRKSHARDGSDSGLASPAGSSRSLRSSRPQYMTVGNGSTSASAAALMASLENDSGYGGSMADDAYTNDGSARTWDPSRTHDIPTPIRPLNDGGEPSPTEESERRLLASHVHQLHYNQNRVALARSINRTVEVLRDLQEMNSTWPAHYPAAQHQDDPARSSTRPGLQHTMTMAGDASSATDLPVRPGALRRAGTSLGEGHTAESSHAQDKRIDQAPETLITPQAAQDFSILKLDLKLQGLSQSEIAHSMDRRAVASLLDGRINQSIRHLQSLRDRIEDTSSKVLVTGDLNAGKSTFCNALLRRKVLPEDQQPCTSIFCEVLDARENSGVEEVHAIHRDVTYDRHDETTYDVYSLPELEKLVIDNETYTQCKVYVKDIRKIDESLLNNGVVDISIIDAPGLNSDTTKTTAVFARQEEIDVVVFVVSAANHFTLSARDFIWNAAQEKAYIFIVVNGYDNIKDKERCQKMILEQVANLSPRTFKESAELVHFVSSNAIPVAPALPAGGPGGDGGGGGSGSSSGPSGNPDDDDNDESLGKHGEPGSPPGKGKGKAKDKENMEDFGHLESALRRFVLEKRARSKLTPAKTYLTNVLSDLNYLATVNRDVAQAELDKVSKELKELEPAFEKSKRARTEVSDDIEKTIETTCADIYKHTRESLGNTISRVADEDLGVEYPGLLSVFEFAEDIKTALLDQISAAVALCEEEARQRTVEGVGAMKSLGTKHLGDEYKDLNFRSDMMFRRKKDALARTVDTPIEIWDFFDVSSLWERQEKVAGTGMAMTVAGVVGGRLVGGVGWLDGALGAAKIMGGSNIRRMIVPGIVATGKLFGRARIPVRY